MFVCKPSLNIQTPGCLSKTHWWPAQLLVRSHMREAETGGGGRKIGFNKNHYKVHTYAVAERRRGGSKIRSATNRSNIQFSASVSKPRTPNHLCPQEMAHPSASAPRMCEHTRRSGAARSKSARFRSATAPRIFERSFRLIGLQWKWVPRRDVNHSGNKSRTGNVTKRIENITKRIENVNKR